jgi:hypothetical protein
MSQALGGRSASLRSISSGAAKFSGFSERVKGAACDSAELALRTEPQDDEKGLRDGDRCRTHSAVSSASVRDLRGIARELDRRVDRGRLEIVGQYATQPGNRG